MISQTAGRVVMAIRDVVGEKMLGIGLEELFSNDYTEDLDPFQLLAGIEEAEAFGYVKVTRIIGQPRQGVPNEPKGLRQVATVSILEPGHKYCDELLK